MRYLKNRYIILIIIVLLVTYLALIWQRKEQTTTGPSSFYAQIFPDSTQTTPSPAPSQMASDLAATTHCLGDQAISQVLGKTYHLQSEQFFPEALLLECKYQAEEPIKMIMPELSYLLKVSNPEAEHLWQAQQAEDNSSSAYRRIEEDPALFANVNPVKELSQVTFYGFANQSYLQLDYTPVREEVGEQLRKGTQLAKSILHPAQ